MFKELHLSEMCGNILGHNSRAISMIRSRLTLNFDYKVMQIICDVTTFKSARHCLSEQENHESSFEFSAQ